MYGTQPTWVILLTLIGSISLTKSAVSLIGFLCVFFLRPTKDLKSRYGPWAVVTGATEGIGKALAFELARQGLHLVLVGRNPNKLQAATSALLQEYPTTKIKTVIFDLAADDTTDGLRRLREEIEGLDVGVVINNAGVSNRFAMMFDEELDGGDACSAAGDAGEEERRSGEHWWHCRRFRCLQFTLDPKRTLINSLKASMSSINIEASMCNVSIPYMLQQKWFQRSQK